MGVDGLTSPDRKNGNRTACVTANGPDEQQKAREHRQPMPLPDWRYSGRSWRFTPTQRDFLHVGAINPQTYQFDHAGHVSGSIGRGITPRPPRSPRVPPPSPSPRPAPRGRCSCSSTGPSAVCSAAAGSPAGLRRVGPGRPGVDRQAVTGQGSGPGGSSARQTAVRSSRTPVTTFAARPDREGQRRARAIRPTAGPAPLPRQLPAHYGNQRALTSYPAARRRVSE